MNSETPVPGGSGSGEEDFKKRPLPIDATQDEKARMMLDNESDKVTGYFILGRIYKLYLLKGTDNIIQVNVLA